MADEQLSRAAAGVASPPIPPLAALAVGVAAASTASIFVRYAQGYAPSLVIAAYRMALATLVLLPVVLTRGRASLRAMAWRQIWLSALSGVFLAVHFATWITSLQYTSVASSVVLVSTAPLFVALLSPSVLHETISARQVAGLGLALLGTLAIGLNDACSWEAALRCPSAAQLVAGGAAKGDLLALVGALAVACYMLIGRALRSDVPLLPYISLTYGSAAVTLLGTVLILRLPMAGYPAAAYGWFALLALLPQLVAHSTYNWALRYLSAAYVSVSLLGEPVGSTLLAFVLLGERPGPLKLVGGVMILVGIVIASWAAVASDA
jgi:drug/metabolite transporter (DMT)-like permease